MYDEGRMKFRIKYSNTQKFTVEVEESTFGNLKQAVKSYLSSAYGIHIGDISLSFNGKEVIAGEDASSLSSLGIVKGDLLVVLQSSASTSSSTSTPPSASAKLKTESTAKKKMERNTDGNVCSNVKVSNMMEAVDGVPPPSVVDAFERYSPSSINEALNLLIHIAMIEAGFIVAESYSGMLPSSWKEMAATLKYRHPGFQNFACTIVIVTMGDIKQVLASFPGQESEISVKLETKEYCQSSQILPHRLTKLAPLSRNLRNNLLYPLQVAAHLTLGLPAPWHIAGLPQEVLIKIASLLDLRSLISLSSTCSRIHTSLLDKQLWYNLFKRDFNEQYHSSDTVGGADWKEKYKAAYKRKKNFQKEKRTFLEEEQNPDAFPRPFPNPNPNPLYDPFGPYAPQPRGPGPFFPPQPYPEPNPFGDPDSPYFGGEIPRPPNPFPGQPHNPFDPFGGAGPRRPNPFQPPFMPPQPRNPRGPRFDFI